MASWSGAVTDEEQEPIRRFTLTFNSRQQEQGFLQHSAEHLLFGIIACSTVGLSYCIMWLIAMWVWSEGLYMDEIGKLRHGSVVAGVLVYVAVAVTAWSPRLHKRIGLMQRECGMAVLSVLTLFEIAFARRRILVQLLGTEASDGHDEADWCDSNTGHTDSETEVMLQLVIVVISTLFVMRIRWIIVVFVEVAAFVVFLIVVVAFRRCNHNIWLLILLLAILLFLTAIGKRQTEHCHRILFMQIVRERQLRATVEFQSTISSQSIQRYDDGDTTCSSAAGRMIQGISQAEQPHLEALADIGRREQWLLDEADVSINTKGNALLGIGGFGIVASGRYQMMPVALKFVKRHTGSHSMMDIGNELRVLRKLHHPNIVIFHGACADFKYGDIVLVLERVFGEPLDGFVQMYHAGSNQSSLQVQGAFQVLLGASRALVYLHSRRPPIVHGDLKGANIVVERHSTGPQAKLLDFGLARVVSRQVTPLGGTLCWAPPEMFARRVPTPAADVFSFSRVMFFVFVGKRPLAEVDRQTILKAGTMNCALPLAWPSDVSPEVEWCRPLVEEASTLEPQSRPSMFSICKELEYAVFYTRMSTGDEEQEFPGEKAKLPSLSFYGLDTTGTDAEDFWERIREFRRHRHRRNVQKKRAPKGEYRPHPSSVPAACSTGELPSVKEKWCDGLDIGPTSKVDC